MIGLITLQQSKREKLMEVERDGILAHASLKVFYRLVEVGLEFFFFARSQMHNKLKTKSVNHKMCIKENYTTLL